MTGRSRFLTAPCRRARGRPPEVEAGARLASSAAVGSGAEGETITGRERPRQMGDREGGCPYPERRAGVCRVPLQRRGGRTARRAPPNRERDVERRWAAPRRRRIRSDSVATISWMEPRNSGALPLCYCDVITLRLRVRPHIATRTSLRGLYHRHPLWFPAARPTIPFGIRTFACRANLRPAGRHCAGPPVREAQSSARIP